MVYYTECYPVASFPSLLFWKSRDVPGTVMPSPQPLFYNSSGFLNPIQSDTNHGEC